MFVSKMAWDKPFNSGDFCAIKISSHSQPCLVIKSPSLRVAINTILQLTDVEQNKLSSSEQNMTICNMQGPAHDKATVLT